MTPVCIAYVTSSSLNMWVEPTGKMKYQASDDNYVTKVTAGKGNSIIYVDMSKSHEPFKSKSLSASGGRENRIWRESSQENSSLLPLTMGGHMEGQRTLCRQETPVS